MVLDYKMSPKMSLSKKALVEKGVFTAEELARSDFYKRTAVATGLAKGLPVHAEETVFNYDTDRQRVTEIFNPESRASRAASGDVAEIVFERSVGRSLITGEREFGFSSSIRHLHPDGTYSTVSCFSVSLRQDPDDEDRVNVILASRHIQPLGARYPQSTMLDPLKNQRSWTNTVSLVRAALDNIADVQARAARAKAVPGIGRDVKAEPIAAP